MEVLATVVTLSIVGALCWLCILRDTTRQLRKDLDELRELVWRIQADLADLIEGLDSAGVARRLHGASRWYHPKPGLTANELTDKGRDSATSL